MEGEIRDLRDEFRERLIPRREFIRRATLLGLSLPAATALFAACSSEKNEGNGAPSGEPIKMGALVPLTGFVGILGPPMQNNAQLAVDEINEAGGVMGSQIELIFEDTASDPDTAVERARKLIQQDEVDVIIGVLTSAERWAVALSVTGPAEEIYINPTYYEGGICDPYFFNVGALPNQQIDTFIPWLIENRGASTFFLGGSDYAWPRGSFAAAKAAIEAGGGSVVAEEYSPLGNTDFSSTLRKIQSAGPDVVYPLYAGSDGITFMTQFVDFGLHNETLPASTAFSELIIDALPVEESTGWIASFEYFMTIDTPENQDFVTRYQERFGEDAIMDSIGQGMFTSVNLYAKGAEQAGSLEKDAVVEGMRQVEFEDPKGLIKIDPTTQAAHLNDYIAEIAPPGDLAGWQRFSIVQTYEDITPQQECLDEPPG